MENDIHSNYIPTPKRIRLSTSEFDGYESGYSSLSGTFEYGTGGPMSNGEGTQTSDSGFNESPIHIIEEENSQGQPDLNRPEENEVSCEEENSMDSTISNLSDLSSASDTLGTIWKPCTGSRWVDEQMMAGQSARAILEEMFGISFQVSQEISEYVLWQFLSNITNEPGRREKLRHINTIADVVRLITISNKIILLTGAGVSVSCGIPDFRSKNGIYARLTKDFPSLPDPQAMFDINYFKKDPRPFFNFAKEIYPGQFQPSKCHRFIRALEKNKKLLRNYTQNIDTLEHVAGIKNVLQCHGSFATATCQVCGRKVDCETIKEDIFKQIIPLCTHCPRVEQSNEVQSPYVNATNNLSLNTPSAIPPKMPVMKPDIVFFGEGLSDEYHETMDKDKYNCDLLIVIGSSLKVRPVSLLPHYIPPNVPQILINREPLPHLAFDVELLGDCDVIISELCNRLGGCWDEFSSENKLSEICELPPRHITTPPDDAPPKDERDIEALKSCWVPKVRENVADRLPENTYFYNGRSRYVYPGAEIYYDPDDEDDDDSDTSSTISSTPVPQEENVSSNQSQDISQNINLTSEGINESNQSHLSDSVSLTNNTDHNS